MKLEFYIDQISAAGEYRPKPDYSDLKFSIQNDKGKGKLSCSGNIVLYGADYDYFIGTIQGWAYGYTIYIINKGATFLEVNFKSISITSQNESLKKISLQIKPDTIYTLDAWTNYDKEYNINELAAESTSLYFRQGHFPMEYTTEAVTHYNVAINIANLTPFALANYDIHYMVCQFSGPWTGIYNVVNVLHKRQIGYGFYIGATAYDPEGNVYAYGVWDYLDDIVYDGRDIPRYRRKISQTYTTSPGSQPYNTVTNSTVYYEDYSIEYTGVTRKVTSVIAFLLTKMGITVSYDNGGTTTDSFYSFKNLTGSSLTYDGVATDKYMAHLLIMNLTDFVPAADDGQKDVKASETMVSLKTVLEFFERRGFEWWIEDRTGTDYFILKHKSHKTLGSGNPNLANYKGRNWNRENAYEIEDPEFHKLTNESENNTIDFRGTDLVMSNIYGTDSVATFNDNNVYTDLDDMATRRHDVYDEFGNNNIVIIAAQTGGATTTDYVRERAGLLSLIGKNNSEMSYSYNCRYLISDLPDTAVGVNGTSYTAASWQLKKRSKVTFNIPITANILIDFDVQDYVSHYGDSCEIEQISQKADENTYNLTLMK